MNDNGVNKKITPDEKLSALKMCDEGKTLKEFSKIFNTSSSSLIYWKKNKDNILRQVNQNTNPTENIKNTKKAVQKP